MPVLTDREALLAAVIAAPGDDRPRLVYADWLEENGEEARAEFIRVQCELAERGFPGPTTLRIARLAVIGGRDCDPLALRACQLLHRHAAEWLGDLMFAGIIKVIDEGMGWSRGFVAEVRGPLAALAGGPCQRCYGSGNTLNAGDRSDPAAFPCPACGGSGRAPGVLAATVAAHPVERVECSDKRPLQFDGRYLWHNTAHRLVGDDNSPDHLPLLVFERLTGYIPRAHRVNDAVRSYPTHKAATDALSAALLAHARAAGATACRRPSPPG